MSDTQAQEAERLAEWLEADACDLQTPREAAALLRSQAARIAELEAARFAYASEFGVDDEGLPDKGSIHANIRAIKAERDALRAELARMREPLSDEQIDALRVESAKAMQSIADRGLIPAPEVCDEDLVRRVEAANGITKTGGGV